MFKKELDQEEQSFLKALDNDFDNISPYMPLGIVIVHWGIVKTLENVLKSEYEISRC
jgi:hypothetical protein